ncbi:MAG: PepSY-associated TM helix domain-containing protein [Gammaproteobacteria bacterium]
MAVTTPDVSGKPLASRRRREPKAHPFLPRALHTQQFLRWLRRTHAWLGMAGAVAGVILGISGITLNHRANLSSRLPTDISAYQVEAPREGFSGQSEFERFVQVKLDIKGPATVPRGAAVRPAVVELGSRLLNQPSHFGAYYASAGEALNVSYVNGNAYIDVEHTDRGFFSTLNRLHLASASGTGWILIIDAFSGALIVLSVTGILLWSRLTGPRLLAISLVGLMLFGASYYANLL